MTHRPLTTLAAGLLVAAVLAGCVEERPVGPDASGPTIVALANEFTHEFSIDIGLSLAYCTTTVAYTETVAGVDVPSMVTGVSCALPAAWDGFLAFGRKLSCYTGGTLATPSTWTGNIGAIDPPTDANERVFSAVVTDNASAYANSAVYLDPLTALTPGITHCLYEAEALVLATPDDSDPRAVFHLEHPPRLNWRVVIEPVSGSYDLHFGGSPILSSVTTDFPFSVTASLPSDTVKGHYPATFDYATIVPVTLGSSPTYGAARVRYVLDTAFPVAALGAQGWAERDIAIKDGSAALDAEIDSTCARTNASSGALEAIGVLFRKVSDHSLFGAAEVLSTLGADRFECERTSGFCQVIPWSGQGGTANCLQALEPVVFVTSGTYTPGVAYTGSNARFASIADADAICEATKGALHGSYVAWLSDATHDAKDALSARGLRRSDGPTVASSLTDLTDGTLTNAIVRDEGGTAITTNLNVWTGTASDGTASTGGHCAGWTSEASGGAGEIGAADATGTTWTASTTLACDQAAHLYCVQVP